jgi:hypothetical protein
MEIKFKKKKGIKIKWLGINQKIKSNQKKNESKINRNQKNEDQIWLKKHKKLNDNGWNWKTNKWNSIQLKDWRQLCNFARLAHPLMWRREKQGGGEKLSHEAPSCHRCRHVLAQHVEGDTMLWTMP